MTLTKTLENLTRKFLPPSAARFAKRASVSTRYRSQISRCREGFRAYGDRYPNPVLFIAGLPKSGTTWLEKMVGSFPGYDEVMIPEVAAHEMATGGSHGFDLPEDMFGRFERALVLTKMHVHGSPHNVELLHRAGVPYVVLFRDLRDVAVSNFFYVRNTPWHPEHPHYAGQSVRDGLLVFAERTLGAYADWVRSWHANRDPERSLVLRYEELLEDDRGCLKRVATLFGLDDSDETVERIAAQNSFKAMSGGRARGQGDGSAFVRKGVAGDWVNHFDDQVRDAFKERVGGFLVEFGYETGSDW